MVITVLLAGGCSNESSTSSRREGVGSASQAIQGGTTDTTHKYAVGVCHGNPGSCSGICSGALILPNVVATARHCVDAAPAQIDCAVNPSFGARKGGSFSITTNTTMGTAASGWFSVDSIAVPTDAHICGNDIALLILTNAVPPAIATPITPGVQYMMWDPDHYIPYFVGIGYGDTSPTAGGSGTRRLSQSIKVLCVPGSFEMDCPPAFPEKEFVGGDGTCAGDSGSSAFEYKTFEDGAPVSFGVLSRGSESDDQTRCEASVYTRFDAHRDWVIAVGKAASNNWQDYPEPSWTAYKPPPTKPAPKDAGAPKDSGPAEKPPARGLGETCEQTTDCESGVCADPGNGTFICSKACDDTEEASCPDRYECRDSLCLPAEEAVPAPAAPASTTTTSGCRAVPGSSRPGTTWSLAALGAIFAVAAARGRKRS
jgi:hypothetical protein